VLYGGAGSCPQRGEDAVQETFMALLQRAEEPENPSITACVCFRNRAMNYHRSFLAADDAGI